MAALTIGVVGLLMERIFLRPLGFDPLRQVLLTVGFAFLFQQAALDIWTGNNFDINPPDELTGASRSAGIYLPLYRVFMIATALVIGIVLWLVMERPGWAPRCVPPSTTRRWRAASASTPRAFPC